MLDEAPSAKLAVYIFLEMIALGFALEAVASLMRGESWWKWTSAVLTGIVFMVLGVKSGRILERFSWRFNSRLVWMAVFVALSLFSLYSVQRLVAPNLNMHLHQRLQGWIGFATVGLAGAALACTLWWLAGKMSSPTTATETSNAADEDTQYGILNLPPEQKAKIAELKAPLFKYKATVLESPQYYALKKNKDEMRAMIEGLEEHYGCLIDTNELKCLVKPPETITAQEVEINIKAKLVADEMSKTFFWVIRGTTSKLRVPIVLFVSLTNRQKEPLKINLVYLEARTVGGWAGMRMADTLFYSAPETMEQKPLVLEAKNAAMSMRGEYLIPSLYDRVIQPGDKIEGWIIAEYPKGIKYGNSLGDMRLSLHAANGWIASQTFPANPRVYDNKLSREWYFAPLDTLITEDQ
jgi:hypothetical protein